MYTFGILQTKHAHFRNITDLTCTLSEYYRLNMDTFGICQTEQPLNVDYLWNLLLHHIISDTGYIHLLPVKYPHKK